MPFCCLFACLARLPWHRALDGTWHDFCPPAVLWLAQIFIRWPFGKGVLVCRVHRVSLLCACDNASKEGVCAAKLVRCLFPFKGSKVMRHCIVNMCSLELVSRWIVDVYVFCVLYVKFLASSLGECEILELWCSL